MKVATRSALLLLLSVSAASAGVSVDYDEEYDFSTKKTFSWGEGTPASELNEKRIVRAVEEQLTAKNLTPVTEPGAKGDLIVVTHAASDEQTRKKASIGIGLSRSIGMGHVGIGTSAPVGAKKIRVGSLVIELLDGETGALVWQANATETLNSNPQSLEAQINKVIQKAFKKFPPRR